MGAGATALTTVEQSKPIDASELSDAGAATELQQLMESLARMEAVSKAVQPVLATSGADGADPRSMVANLRQAMATALNKPAEEVVAEAAAARAAGGGGGGGGGASGGNGGSAGVPQASGAREAKPANGPHVKAAIDRIQLSWSEWWEAASGGNTVPEGGFRVLLRKAKPDGAPNAWAFVPVPDLHTAENPKTIRTKGGLEQGAAYELQVQAVADGKATHTSDTAKVVTTAATVVNVGANPGAHYIDAWWKYEGPGVNDETWTATEAPPKFLLLVRQKPDAPDQKAAGWRWIEAQVPPTAEHPLRLTDPSITPDTMYEICIRYTLLGQSLETVPIDVQTASQGPAATGVGGRGEAEAIQIWWQFDRTQVAGEGKIEYLVCLRQADANENSKWSYLAADAIHTPEHPFKYEVAGGLIPNTTYAVCIKVELPDGSITTSDVATILTDPTSRAKELAQAGSAMQAEHEQRNLDEAHRKHLLLEEKLAKRRAAKAAKAQAAA